MALSGSVHDVSASRRKSLPGMPISSRPKPPPPPDDDDDDVDAGAVVEDADVVVVGAVVAAVAEAALEVEPRDMMEVSSGGHHREHGQLKSRIFKNRILFNAMLLL
jgi:hypothetical protein